MDRSANCAETPGNIPGAGFAGATAFCSTLSAGSSWDAIACAFAAVARKAGVNLSDDAGRFVCNYLYYCSLERHPCVFVHVPPLDKVDLEAQVAPLAVLPFVRPAKRKAAKPGPLYVGLLQEEEGREGEADDRRGIHPCRGPFRRTHSAHFRL